MNNMIQLAKEQVLSLTRAAYAAAVQAGTLPEVAEVKANVEIPKDAPTATTPPPLPWPPPRP